MENLNGNSVETGCLQQICLTFTRILSMLCVQFANWSRGGKPGSFYLIEILKLIASPA